MILELSKIRSIFPRHQKKALLILGFLVLVGMFLEIFSLGVLIPILRILVDPDQTFEILNQISNIDFSIYKYEKLLMFSLLLILIVYVIKTVFMVYLTYKQNRITEGLGAFTQIKLFEKNLNLSYIEFLERDFSKAIKNIQIESNNFNVYVKSILTLTVEVAFVFSIILTILFIEPIGGLLVGTIFGILAFLYFQFSKVKIKDWGNKRDNYDIIISKTLFDSLSGIKEVKLFQKEEYFESKFVNNQLNKVKISSNYHTLIQISRFFFELIAIIGMVSLILILVYNNFSTEKTITILGIFVAASFKIIPSINRIVSSMQSIKYYERSLDIISKELNWVKNPLNKETNPFNFETNFKIENLSFKYKGKLILEDINLEIKKGETIGIIGETGSGKSTLADLIIGLLKPSKGKIMVDKINIQNFPISWFKTIGYVSQDIFLIDDTIKANIAFADSPEKIDLNKINNSINSAQLKSFIDELEEGLDTKVGERGVQLSGGQIQRIGIARALYNNPDFLIFDESTASLDIETEKKVMESIYNLDSQKTILIIAHRLSTLERCDKIFKIEDKKLIIC